MDPFSESAARFVEGLTEIEQQHKLSLEELALLHGKSNRLKDHVTLETKDYQTVRMGYSEELPDALVDEVRALFHRVFN